MRRYPDGAAGKVFFQKDAPVAHAGLDPDVPRTRCRHAHGQEARDRVPGRQRRAGAPVDGEHGLHRHEPLVLAGRQARPARLRALRPRPDAGGALRADRRGGADPQGAARRDRPAVVPEDLGRQGLPRARPARPAVDLRGHAALRRARCRGDRGRLSEARHDGLVEGEAEGRPDRREPERDGEDDRVGLLGAPAPRARRSRRRSPGTR